METNRRKITEDFWLLEPEMDDVLTSLSWDLPGIRSHSTGQPERAAKRHR